MRVVFHKLTVSLILRHARERKRLKRERRVVLHKFFTHLVSFFTAFGSLFSSKPSLKFSKTQRNNPGDFFFFFSPFFYGFLSLFNFSSVIMLSLKLCIWGFIDFVLKFHDLYILFSGSSRIMPSESYGFLG